MQHFGIPYIVLNKVILLLGLKHKISTISTIHAIQNQTKDFLYYQYTILLWTIKQ